MTVQAVDHVLRLALHIFSHPEYRDDFRHRSLLLFAGQTNLPRRGGEHYGGDDDKRPVSLNRVDDGSNDTHAG